jgi:hypothetical protein
MVEIREGERLAGNDDDLVVTLLTDLEQRTCIVITRRPSTSS